jgi:hypothetical protein
MMIGEGTETHPYVYIPEGGPLGSLFLEGMRLALVERLDGLRASERAEYKVRTMKCASGRHVLAVLYGLPDGSRVLELRECNLTPHMVQLILKLHGDEFESRPVFDDGHSAKYTRVCVRLPEVPSKSLLAAHVQLACPCMWCDGLTIGDMLGARGRVFRVAPDVSAARGRRADTAEEVVRWRDFLKNLLGDPEVIRRLTERKRERRTDGARREVRSVEDEQTHVF